MRSFVSRVLVPNVRARTDPFPKKPDQSERARRDPAPPERHGQDSGGPDSMTGRRRGGAMRIALVGNYVPRKCGIATFTHDIVEQFAKCRPEVRFDVHAMQDEDAPVVHQGVSAEIIRTDRDSYRKAARALNEQEVDAVWIQHEFGIFGGECGEYVLDFAERVAAPLVVTLHTVLADPSPRQEAIVRRLVARARQVMVMSEYGRDLVVSRYGADVQRVRVIEHGAPDRPLRLSDISGPDARPVLMTFGLLGPGKGLESAIEAMPAIIARHPHVLYRIVGVSHPNELRAHGEQYRHSLEALAERLGVAAHIEWINHFVDMDELVDLLEDCAIYLTPYPNLQQSTSGTLSYAVALGRAVVSTPYVHARELLRDTGGRLVEPRNAAAIAEAVNSLLNDPSELAMVQMRTYDRGRRTTWRHFVAHAHAMLEAATAPRRGSGPCEHRFAPSIAAFDSLCDSTGMLQHGNGVVPDLAHGYCLDDNARALMLASRMAWPDLGEALRRATPFAAFIQHAWNEDERRFRNFMRYDRSWNEAAGSEDSNGRAIWVMGDCHVHSPVAGLNDWALRGFERFGHIALELTAPRAMAFAALGAAMIEDQRPGHGLAQQILLRTGERLSTLLAAARRPGWTWFEPVVAYDNVRLPQALIECGVAAGQDDWRDAGLEALHWILARQSSADGLFRPPGSEGFGQEGEFFPFDQQPLEAWATIDACASASRLTRADGDWAAHAARAWRWFLGDNDRGVALADPRTGICLDGVTPHGANANCGAESVLAFHLAHHSYRAMQDRISRKGREDAVKAGCD